MLPNHLLKSRVANPGSSDMLDKHLDEINVIKREAED
jgi:hypothetical protein